MGQFQVRAKENSVSGGTGRVIGTFKHGDHIVINCNPEQIWYLAPNWKTNANGFADNIVQKGDQFFHAGAMVGSFDDGKTFFSIGTCLAVTVTAVANARGDDATLKLYCWDSDKDNNDGYIDAYVEGGV